MRAFYRASNRVTQEFLIVPVLSELNRNRLAKIGKQAMERPQLGMLITVDSCEWNRGGTELEIKCNTRPLDPS